MTYTDTMPEQWQMCRHLSSTGNKDMSELILAHFSPPLSRSLSLTLSPLSLPCSFAVAVIEKNK